MNKYAIVVDSSCGLTPEQQKTWDVYVAPLTIIHNNKNYEDQVTITYDDVKELLTDHAVLKTSQPNIGSIIELLDDVKGKGYDHVFVLSLSSTLSGTFTAFNHAIEESGLTAVTLLDSFTLAGPIQNMIRTIRNSEENGETVAQIEAKLNPFVDNTTTYVYPQDLKQLKASGRISSSAATLASLLKIKPVLRYDNHGVAIEKFATARTETKALETIIADLNTHGVNKDDHEIYILSFEAQEVAEKMETQVHQAYGDIAVHHIVLPAAIATHAGIGTIAVQWTLKVA